MSCPSRNQCFLTLLISLVFQSCSNSPPSIERTIYLSDRLNTIETVQASGSPIASPHLAIGADERRVLTQYAPSVIRFPDIPSGPGAVFHVAPSMLAKSWEKPTDGVAFEIACDGEDGERRILLQRNVEPQSKPSDQAWNDFSLSLQPCSSPVTTLELSTGCGAHSNCVADWSVWGSPRITYSTEWKPRPGSLVILISIDTLRPDRMSAYGAHRDTTPELHQLARDGVLFENAIASAPWTIPSHATLLTSTEPSVHGALTTAAIPDSLPILAETLQEAGWTTGGFVDSTYVSHQFGFDRGFDHFDDKAPPQGDYRRGAAVVLERLADWLGREAEGPSFLFWHIMDVHGPYWAPAPFGGRYRSRVAPREDDPRFQQVQDLGYHDYLMLDRFHSYDELVAAYDEGLAATDFIIGRLLQRLRDTGRYEDALIVVTSDHGESFQDHGVWTGHGLFLTDDEIRVPLIIKLPGDRLAKQKQVRMVGQIDVAPTILDLVGIDIPTSFQGQPLFEDGRLAPTRQVLYGSSTNTSTSFLRTNRLKYISAAPQGEHWFVTALKPNGAPPTALKQLTGEQLYDLLSDSGESRLAEPNALGTTSDQLRAQITLRDQENRIRRTSLEESAVGPLSPEEEARLRSLGYGN